MRKRNRGHFGRPREEKETFGDSLIRKEREKGFERTVVAEETTRDSQELQGKCQLLLPKG